MKNKIVITERLRREIEVEADNYLEALEKIKELYYNSEIVLNAEDFVEVEFKKA